MILLIKSVRLLNPSTNDDRLCDILIEEGVFSRIFHIGEGNYPNPDITIDGKGMWAAPGLIDVHCHLREPGFEYKETIATGAKSAVMGGFTTICPMPNTVPVIDTADKISFIVQKAKEEAAVNILPVGAITEGMSGDTLTDIPSLVKAGACAISEDGKTVKNSGLMLESMIKAKELSIPVLCHCQDVSLSKDGVMNEGVVQERLSLPGISDESEEVIIKRDLELAAQSGAHVHICHVSTKGGVRLIKDAKSKYKNITAEVCPHHFSLTDSAVEVHMENAKMAPPLRDEDDVKALIAGLSDGTIDIIATDHAPHSKEEKQKGMLLSPFGIIGFETALSLAITNLVDKGYLTPLKLIEKMSLNPAKLIGVDKGRIEVGRTADLVIIDADYRYTADVNSFHSKSRNCPYGGMELKGKVFATIVSGKIIVGDYGRLYNAY